MVTSLQYDKVLAIHKIAQPVLICDSPGPRTLQPIFQLLGFANSATGIPKTGINELIYAFDNFSVGHLPMLVVLPGQLTPGETHLRILVSSIKTMGLDLSGACPVIGVKKAPRVCWGAKEVRRLLPRGILISWHEDGVTFSGDDLDGFTIRIHALDQRKQGLSRFACTYRHDGAFPRVSGTDLWHQSSPRDG